MLCDDLGGWDEEVEWSFKSGVCVEHTSNLGLVVKSLVTSSSFCDSMDCSPAGPIGFPRQNYWSGLPYPFPGDIPDPGIEPMSP